MSKEKFKRAIYLFLVILWMVTVFMFSNQNGEESQKTSESFTKIIVKLLTFNQEITKEEELKIIQNAGFIVRKLAHYSIYALGGILIYNYTNTYKIEKNKKILVAIIIGILYAIIDEFHQYFVSNRSAQALDVCIDSIGVLTGVAFIYLIKHIKKPLNN